jgi:beta-1,2-mannobiose phosphorylase / 1,2-beta-oligomannan phosphorylase
MNIERCKFNPIITCKDVTPTTSIKDLEVVGVMNPGATKYKDEIVILMRVAERVKSVDENYIKVPYVDSKDKSEKVITLNKKNSEFDFSDSRTVKRVGSSCDFEYLTSMSHIRIARSRDGINFNIDSDPFIFPEDEYESFGVEDPRITKIDDKYYITYSAVSKYGIVVKLAETRDFVNYKKLGNIFDTENKDVVIFPEKIGKKYFALNRPVSKSTGKPIIWIAESENLIDWGNYKVLAETRDNSWDSKKIGAGVPPIRTDRGWLEIYHGVDKNDRYSMGALLLDLDNPEKVIARSKKPILEPCEEYEKNGFFSNVVFPCGAVKVGEKLYIYYGASDNSIGLAISSIDDILSTLCI